MRRVLGILTLLAFTLTAIGCHSTKQFLVTERQRIKESQKIYKVETLDGRVIRFDSDPLGYAVMRDTTIERFMKDGSVEAIPLSSVTLIHTMQSDPAATIIGVALAIGGAAFLLIAAIGHGLGSGSW